MVLKLISPKHSPVKKYKNVGWRPKAITPEKEAQIVEIFKIDWTIREACKYVWVSEWAYSNRVASDPEFKERMEKAMEFPKIYAKQVLFKTIGSKTDALAPTWSVEFLKRRDERYTDKQDNTLNWWTLAVEFESLPKL